MKLPDLPKIPELLSEEEKTKFKSSLQGWIKFIEELYPTIKGELHNIQQSGEEIVAPLSVFGPIPTVQMTITPRSRDFMLETTLICPTIKDVQAKIEMLFPDDKSTNIETA